MQLVIMAGTVGQKRKMNFDAVSIGDDSMDDARNDTMTESESEGHGFRRQNPGRERSGAPSTSVRRAASADVEQSL